MHPTIDVTASVQWDAAAAASECIQKDALRCGTRSPHPFLRVSPRLIPVGLTTSRYALVLNERERHLTYPSCDSTGGQKQATVEAPSSRCPRGYNRWPMVDTLMLHVLYVYIVLTEFSCGGANARGRRAGS